MRLKVLTTCDNPNHPGYKRLEQSLIKHGLDYECIVHPFSFGHQLPVIQKWCENNNDYTHILYTDAYDTICFGYEIPNCKMLISCEKACYPYPERANEYPDVQTPWKYVNGGGWLVEVEYFRHLCKKENLNAESHDQVWLMEAYLRNKEDILLDNYCEVFQTIAFSTKDEWERVGDRWINIGTQTLPCFFHGNGRTEMSWLQ